MDNKDYYNNNRDYYDKEYSNKEYSNKEYDNNHSGNSRFRLLPISLAIIVIVSLIIVEDEFSGKNRIKKFFNLFQRKIETILKGDDKGNDRADSSNNGTYTKSDGSEKLEEKADNKLTFNEVEKKYKEKYAHLYELQENDLLEIVTDDEQQSLVLTKIALDKDYGKLLDEIIKKNSNIVNSDKIGDNSLIYAAEKHSRKCVEVLINHGADLKFELEDGRNMLHVAAKNYNIPLAKQALMVGIPVDKKTKNGKSPLYYAVKNNDIIMTCFLVDCGADKDDNSLKSVTNDKRIQKFLKDGKKPAKYLDVNSELTPEEKEWRQAYEYIRDGKLTDLYNLAKSGKDLFKMTYHGEPAPCIAAKYGQYEILKYLLHEFDCKNLIDYETGRNALHYAAQQANDNIVDLLISKGFDVNSTDLYNNTPLHYAINNTYPYNVQVLLHNGADPDKYNLKRQTPLHLAAQKGNVMAVCLFLKEGANIYFQDYLGNTALHYIAVGSSDRKVLELLYSRKEPLNLEIKNNKGETPRTIRWDCYKYYEEHHY